MRLALAASVAMLIAAAPAAASEKLYGLIVGIDDYLDAVNHLDGAVNDAQGIADALRKVKADKVIEILDRDATKSAIQHAWYDLVHTAGPGDTIVFSYAGHGGQEPEPPGWHEPSGKSSNFLLAGYRTSGPGSLERIVSWEMYQWLKAADDKGIEVVFVADSCHSGNMYRSVKTEVRYRQWRGAAGKFADPDLAGDLIKLPPAEAETLHQNDFKHLTYIGATQDNMLDPEVTIEGVPHGALSWAFAKAVATGSADPKHAGKLTQQDLLAYLVPTVQTAAENQQIPSIAPLRPEAKPILRDFTLFDKPDEPKAGPPPAPPADKTIVRLLVKGGVPAGLPEVAGIQLTDDDKTADLIWDRAGRTVDSRIGGRVAEKVQDADMPAILSKASAVAFLKARMADSPVSLSLASGNQTYKIKDVVQFDLKGVRFPYLTLFNMPPDGKVEFLWPSSDKEVKADFRNADFNAVIGGGLEVKDPPFGTETLVAIFTAEPAVALQAALKSMPTAATAGGLAATLRSSLADKDFQAGVVNVFTTGGG